MVPRQTGTGCDVCVRLQSAAALCVGVGSFSDPSDLPGLAHFLEHSEYKKGKRGERIRSLLLFGQRLMFPPDSPVVSSTLKSCPVFITTRGRNHASNVGLHVCLTATASPPKSFVWIPASCHVSFLASTP